MQLYQDYILAKPEPQSSQETTTSQDYYVKQQQQSPSRFIDEMLDLTATLQPLPPVELYPFRVKVIFPQNAPSNIIGLILGPKGTYQKKLEEESGCKILIRGRNTQSKDICSFDTEDDSHIMIIGDTQAKVARGRNLVEQLIYADEGVKQQIRLEQLRMVQQQQAYQPAPNLNQDHLMTPYGAPSPDAYILPVPNECVGLVIGKGGEMIRQLQLKTGVKISVAKAVIPETNQRNVFVEGSLSKYDQAKQMIGKIIDDYFQNQVGRGYKDELSTQDITMCDASQNDATYVTPYEMQPTAQSLAFLYQQQYFIPHQSSDALRSQQTFQQQAELQLQLEKQLEVNPFPGPHTFVSIPNQVTAFIIGYNGERIRKLHQLTGAYIFIPKDYNTLTDERLIQLSGNDKSVEFCKREIKYIVQQVAPLLGINLAEFKVNKKNIKENFKTILQQKGSLKLTIDQKPMGQDSQQSSQASSNSDQVLVKGEIIGEIASGVNGKRFLIQNRPSYGSHDMILS